MVCGGRSGGLLGSFLEVDFGVSWRSFRCRRGAFWRSIGGRFGVVGALSRGRFEACGSVHVERVLAELLLPDLGCV